MTKHIPLRKCVGCGEMKPKTELLRIFKTPDILSDNGELIKGSISIDLTLKASGRGAYICKDSECLKHSRKTRRLERTFSCKISEEFYDKLLEIADNNA